jgi:hypothetical protein
VLNILKSRDFPIWSFPGGAKSTLGGVKHGSYKEEARFCGLRAVCSW